MPVTTRSMKKNISTIIENTDSNGLYIPTLSMAKIEEEKRQRYKEASFYVIIKHKSQKITTLHRSEDRLVVIIEIYKAINEMYMDVLKYNEKRWFEFGATAYLHSINLLAECYDIHYTRKELSTLADECIAVLHQAKKMLKEMLDNYFTDKRDFVMGCMDKYHVKMYYSNILRSYGVVV
jgi:hypothetical protein